MIPHPLGYQQQLTIEDCESVYRGALQVLEKAGIVAQSEEMCRAMAEAGAKVDMRDQRIRLSPDMVESRLAAAPRRWTLHARNPQRSVEVGADALLVSPGYGSPSVADEKGRRRDATLSDFRSFAALAGESGCIDITGGLLVEPLDVRPDMRALETARALLELSDKPFLGSVAGVEGARDSIALARLAHPDLERRPVMMGLVNINSPLRLDARMAGAMMEYVTAGQAVLLTPGILMGVTAPVTAAGAMVQALAELLACVTVVQVLRPGAPVMIGTGGFGSDMRTGGPGFGRPENAVGTLMGAQLARRVGLPFRCSGAVTGSRLPDCRSGSERMMTALAAWTGGAHLCLQGAGTLDSINSMSYAQFAIDVEMWGAIGRLASRPSVDPEHLAVDLIASLPGDYLGAAHTVEHMRQEMFAPRLSTPQPYDDWVSAGAPSVVDLALLAAAVPGGIQRTVTPLRSEIAKEMESLIASRRRSSGLG